MPSRSIILRFRLRLRPCARPALFPSLPSLHKVSDAQDELQERIDWVIQESTLEGMHPWASAVFAHSSYFSNFDMVMFLVNRLNEGLEEDDDDEEKEGGGEGEEKGGEGKEGKESEEAKAKEESSGVAVEGLVVA